MRLIEKLVAFTLKEGRIDTEGEDVPTFWKETNKKLKETDSTVDQRATNVSRLLTCFILLSNQKELIDKLAEYQVHELFKRVHLNEEDAMRVQVLEGQIKEGQSGESKSKGQEEGKE